MPNVSRQTAASAAVPRPPAPLPTIASAESAAAAPKVSRKPPFWLVYLPGRLAVIADRVLPALQEYVLEHGTNGCREVLVDDGNGGKRKVLNTEDLEHQLRQKRGIKLDWLADDEPYITEAWPDHWVTRWTRLTPGDGHMRVDLEGYADFLERMQERGLLPRNEARHVDRLAQAIRFDLEESTKGGKDSYRADQLRHQLRIVERELELLEAQEVELAHRQAEREEQAAARRAERRTKRSPLPDLKPPARDDLVDDQVDDQGGEAAADQGAA